MHVFNSLSSPVVSRYIWCCHISASIKILLCFYLLPLFSLSSSTELSPPCLILSQVLLSQLTHSFPMTLFLILSYMIFLLLFTFSIKTEFSSFGIVDCFDLIFKKVSGLVLCIVDYLTTSLNSTLDAKNTPCQRSQNCHWGHPPSQKRPIAIEPVTL